MNRFNRIPLWGSYLLVAYMPFHVFLSQSLSLLTGGLDIWKLAKDGFVAGLAAVSLVLAWRAQLHKNVTFRRILYLFAAYAVVHLATFAYFRGTSLSVAMLATAYNLRPILLLIIGIVAAVSAGRGFQVSRMTKFIILISSIVAVIGIIQYFLPSDILTHLGYSETRGVKPNFLIDNKPDLPRIMSTLREPNSLGAYLVLPIALLTVKFREGRRGLLVLGLLILHLLALSLTFSRSAMLALVISEGVLLGVLYRGHIEKVVKKYALLFILGFVVLVAGLFVLRDQYVVQNVVFHSDEHTVSTQDSNQKHLSYVEQGVRAIASQPLGHGPGTAGPVSMHTDKPFITEDYYLQIAYEVGLLGLAVFVAVCVIAFVKLKEIGTPAATALYASLLGYAACNLLLHTWANEAVGTQWWLFAGLVIGGALVQKSGKVYEK